jgi:hypothetical protein
LAIVAGVTSSELATSSVAADEQQAQQVVSNRAVVGRLLV